MEKEFINSLEEQGLKVRKISNYFSILGDPKTVKHYGEDELQVMRWSCIIEVDDKILITPPPILTPGPSPSYEVKDLFQAKLFVMELFKKRNDLKKVTHEETSKANKKLYESLFTEQKS